MPERRGLGVFCLARLVLVRLETQSWPWLTSLASVTPTSPCHPHPCKVLTSCPRLADLSVCRALTQTLRGWELRGQHFDQEANLP